MDDLSTLNEGVFSQASTVQMGSSSSKTICYAGGDAINNPMKKKKKHVKQFHSVPPRSRLQHLGFGSNLPDKILTSRSNEHGVERTPPCTPERDHRNDSSGENLAHEVLRLTPKEIERQKSYQILGIEKYRKQHIETTRRERQDLIRALCGFDHNAKNSQDESFYALPVIHESLSMTRTDSGGIICSRGENSSMCYEGIEI